MATNTRSLVPPRATLARTRRFIVEHKLIAQGATVLAGVSGGPDSTCLLLVLAALRRSLRFTLRVAHFDHQLRAANAARREAQFVLSLCEALDVPFHTGAADVRAHARARRQSIEEAARELRYRFLASTARRFGCDTVAAGHTRDDQAETVLLHVLRGSGLRGLAAMAPASEWPLPGRGRLPRLVRPLLALSRKETEACCRPAGVSPLRDPSNRSPAYLRNRIRRELLPQLRRYNPRVEEALARLADAAADDITLLETLAGAAIVAGAKDSSVRISRRALAGLPSALQRHAVRIAATRLLGDARGLSERHVLAVVRANDGPTGARLDLPRRLRLDVRRDTLVLASSPLHPSRPLPKRAVALPVSGSARLGPWQIETAVLRRRPAGLAVADGRTAFLDADACGGRLSIRSRRPGDRFQPLGLPRPKKLQDFFVDAHVPREERDRVPLLCAKDGIAWVAGQRPAEWAKVTPATRRVLRVRARLTDA